MEDEKKKLAEATADLSETAKDVWNNAVSDLAPPVRLALLQQALYAYDLGEGARLRE